MMAPGDAPPIKCQRFGCNKFVHHLCANKWIEANNLPDETIATLCREHHPQYYKCVLLKAPPTALPDMMPMTEFATTHPPTDNQAGTSMASEEEVSTTAASVVPHIFPIPMKKPKHSEWPAELREMSKKGQVLLNYRDRTGKIPFAENCYIQCITCRDGKGKSDGVIFLRRPFAVQYWEQHASGKKHKENVERYNSNTAVEDDLPRRPPKRTDLHPHLANEASIMMEEDDDIPPEPPKKKSKHSEWPAALRELSEKDQVILNYRDPSGKIPHVENMYVQCILCRDSKGKSDGVINLRRPFTINCWNQHAFGKRHRENVQRYNNMMELRAKEGDLSSLPKQRDLLSFGITKANNTNTVNEETVVGAPCSPLNMQTGETIQDSIDNSAPSTIPREKPTSNADCCGLFNCVRGDYRTILPAIHKLVSLPGDRKYTWGHLAAMPALRSTECTGKGTISVDKLGMMCAPCLDLRRTKGNSNPRRFVSGWANKLEKCFERKKKAGLSTQDVDDAKAFAKIRDIFLTQDGIPLKEEAMAQVEYYKNMMKLTT